MAIMATASRFSAVGKILLAVAFVAWIAIVAKLLTRELVQPNTLEIAFGVGLVVAPFFIARLARVPIYLLVAYAALVPFDDLLSTGVGASFVKLLAFLVGAALILSTIAMRRATSPSRLFVLWALLTAYLGMTTFWAIDQQRAAVVFWQFFEYFVLLAAMAVYPISRRDMWLVLASMIGGSLIAAAFGIYAFHSELNLLSDRLFLATGNDNSIDSNEFAGGFLTPIALTLMMFLRTRVGFTKLLWMAALAILLTGFSMSGSRGGTIAFAAVALFLFWRSRYRIQLAAILFVTAAAILASPIGQRFGANDVATGDGRTEIWKVGIASLRQYWLMGAGIGNFNQAFEQYILATPHHRLGWGLVAHSIFIQSAVESGILGFALTVAVWLLTIRELHRVQGDDLVNDACIALSAGVLGLFVAGFSLDLLSVKYFWLALGLVGLMRSMLVTTGIPLSKGAACAVNGGRKAVGSQPSSALG